MKNTYIKKAVDLLGKEPLRKLLEDIFGQMSRESVNKPIRKGYAPPEWHEIIEIATNHRITADQLMNDVYLNKRNCKPTVVRRKAEKFASGCTDYGQRVGNHRQIA